MQTLDQILETETENAIVFQSVPDQVIAQLKQDFLPLVVEGVDDKEGCKVVNEARKQVKKLRTGLEAERKKKKAKSLEYGRNLDAEAKRLSSQLVEIEDHLMTQEKIVTDEIARKKAEEQKAIEENHKQQIIAIINAGARYNGVSYVHGDLTITDADIWNYSEEEFEKILDDIEDRERLAKEKIAEEKRIAQIKADEEAAEKAESDRLAKIESDRIEKEQAEIRRKQKEEQDKIDADNKKLAKREAKIKAAEKKIADDKAEAQRIKDLEAQKIKDKKQAEEKAEQERIEKIERKKRAEALKPDKEKLYDFISEIKNIEFPAVENEESKILIRDFYHVINNSLDDFINKIEKL